MALKDARFSNAEQPAQASAAASQLTQLQCYHACCFLDHLLALGMLAIYGQTAL